MSRTGLGIYKNQRQTCRFRSNILYQLETRDPQKGSIHLLLLLLPTYDYRIRGTNEIGEKPGGACPSSNAVSNFEYPKHKWIARLAFFRKSGERRLFCGISVQCRGETRKECSIIMLARGKMIMAGRSEYLYGSIIIFIIIRCNESSCTCPRYS